GSGHEHSYERSHGAPVRVAVDGDADRRPFARPQAFHDLRGDPDAGGRLAREEDPCAEPHQAHCPGRKRIALQTSSMGTCRTPWMCCLSRCRQRMSRFRSVPSCFAFGYAIHARRSALAVSTTGPHVRSTSASVLTNTRIASALLDDVTTTSSRSTSAGFPTTRNFMPSF